MRMETGSRSMLTLSALPSAGSEYSCPRLNFCRVLKVLCGIALLRFFVYWAAALALEFGHEARAFFEQRRQVLVAARNRAGIGADLLVQLGKPLFEIGTHSVI